MLGMAALLAGASLAPAQKIGDRPMFSAEDCEPFKPMYDAAKAQGVQRVEMNGEEAAKFIAAYNAIPPISNIDADQVFVARAEDGGFVLAFVKNGCVVEFGKQSPKSFHGTIMGGPGSSV
jgi:hypothetical protein